MPWQMSYSAIAESESAELQTDVMRFMAILAFCLVAIFAIVQSIPPGQAGQPAQPGQSGQAAEPAATVAALAAVSPPVAITPVEPSTPVPGRTTVKPTPQPTSPDVISQQPRAVVLHRAQKRKPVVAARTLPEAIRLQRAALPPPATPTPAAPAAPTPAAPTLAAPTPAAPTPAAPTPAAPTPTPLPSRAAQPAPQPEAEQGLSLRFESDAVLRNLVSTGRVGLYAIDAGRFYAMTVSGTGLRFIPGNGPGQYHEMIDDTVPRDVQASFARQYKRSPDVTWGVTLPVSTSQQLMRFVRTNYTGSLVITADAALALAGS